MGDSTFINKLDDIGAVEERLAEIDAERHALLELKRKLQSRDESSLARYLTAHQKVTIFKDLFRARPDVFATPWENQNGNTGYAVACAF